MLSNDKIFDIIGNLAGALLENKRKIDALWKTSDSTVFIDEVVKYTLGSMILNNKYKVLIIAGVAGYGKSTAIHTIFDKYERKNKKIIFDRRNRKDWLLLQNNGCLDASNDYVVIDNLRDLDQDDYKVINNSCALCGKIILVCRDYKIDINNDYTGVFNCNIYPIECGEVYFIDKKLKKQLPEYMRVPLYYRLLSQYKYDDTILDDLLELCIKEKNYSNKTEFINNFLGTLFQKMSVEEIRLLVLYSMIVSDSNYFEKHLKYLLRKIDLNTFKSVEDNIIGSLYNIFKQEFFFLINKDKHKRFHSVLSDYFNNIYRNVWDEEQKNAFWTSLEFQSVIANINWGLEAGISQPFDKQIEYLQYAYNILNFIKDDFYKIENAVSDIRTLKNLLNFINSYLYISVKAFSSISKLDELLTAQEIVVNTIFDNSLREKWVKFFSNDDYYVTTAQFCNVSAKVYLMLFVNSKDVDVNLYQNALSMCEKSHDNLENIVDINYKNIREDVYFYTKALVLYKGSLFFDELKECEELKIYNCKWDLLKEAINCIEKSEKNAINEINAKFNNINYDFYSYDINEYNKLKAEIKVSKPVGLYLSTLELKCIIYCVAYLIDRNKINKNYSYKLIQFTKSGFYNCNTASQGDKMRFRELALLQLYLNDESDLVDACAKVLYGSECRVNSTENFEDSKFVFLRMLMLKMKHYKNTQIDEMLCNRYNVDLTWFNDASLYDDYLERVFFKLITS